MNSWPGRSIETELNLKPASVERRARGVWWGGGGGGGGGEGSNRKINNLPKDLSMV